MKRTIKSPHRQGTVHCITARRIASRIIRRRRLLERRMLDKEIHSILAEVYMEVIIKELGEVLPLLEAEMEDILRKIGKRVEELARGK